MSDEAVAVAKKRPSGSESRRFNTLVRMDDDLCRKAKQLASLRETTMAEMFHAVLSPWVEREYDKEVLAKAEEVAKRSKAPKPKGGLK